MKRKALFERNGFVSKKKKKFLKSKKEKALMLVWTGLKQLVILQSKG